MGKTKTKDILKGFIVSAITKSNYIAPSQLSAVQIEWQKRAEQWKKIYCKGATDEEAYIFIETCKRTGLSPEKRHIYAVKRKEKGREVLSTQTSIDGFRYIAQRSQNYGGQIGPEWCGDDGVWKDIWLSKEPPRAARCGVVRKDWLQPLWAVAKFESYYQQYSPLWQKMPELMIAKCAEALALRRAFPDELGGLYTEDEMAQADTRAETVDVASLPIATTAVQSAVEIYEGLGEQKRYLWHLLKERDLTENERVKALAENLKGVAMKDLERELDRLVLEEIKEG
jgi:phage recombination protein Bet